MQNHGLSHSNGSDKMAPRIKISALKGVISLLLLIESLRRSCEIPIQPTEAARPRATY